MNDIFISDEDDKIIRNHLKEDPNINMNDLEQTIKDYQKEILMENQKYVKNMDDLHFQQSLVDKKNIKELSLSPKRYLDIGNDKIKELTINHENTIKEIKENLNWCLKVKKIHLSLQLDQNSNKLLKSPRRFIEYAKNNSVLRKSFEKLKI